MKIYKRVLRMCWEANTPLETYDVSLEV